LTYSCISDNSDGTITVYRFLKSKLAKKTSFTFTINSFRNPPVTGSSYTIDFEILAASGGVVDLGSFDFDDNLIVKGNILSFTVEPQNYGVG